MSNFLTSFYHPEKCQMFGVKALKPQFTNVHGYKSDPTNYRGICVSSCLGKLFCSILNRRILLYFEENNTLHNFQIGFLPENHTADHVFTLKTLTDKYVHYHKEKVYAFLAFGRRQFLINLILIPHPKFLTL